MLIPGRVMSLTFNLPGKGYRRLTIIGVYQIPCPNKPKNREYSFKISTAIREELERVLLHNHIVIIAGDTNATLPSPERPEDTWISNLAQENHLQDLFTKHNDSDHPRAYTFDKPGITPRIIDHIMAPDSQSHMWGGSGILHDDTNFLDHACPFACLQITSPVDTRERPIRFNTSDWSPEDKVKFSLKVLQEYYLEEGMPDIDIAGEAYVKDWQMRCLTALHKGLLEGAADWRAGDKPKWMDRYMFDTCKLKRRVGNTLLKVDRRQLTGEEGLSLHNFRCMQDKSPHETLKIKYKELCNKTKASARRAYFKLKTLRKRDRTKLFNDKKYKQFLDLVFNRFSDNSGIVGAYVYVDGELRLSNEQDDVLRVSRQIIKETFFEERVTQPSFTQTWAASDLDSMPAWTHSAFNMERIQQGKTDPLFDTTTDEITMEELERAIKTTSPHKAGGPSGVTIDMIKAAPRQIWEALKDYINAALLTGDIPDEGKTFQIWCIEKSPGAGKWISEETGAKLGVRPISLFEVTTKILERIISARISNIMEKNNKWHHAQMGFRENMSAVEAMMCYMLLIEDAHASKRPIFISSNDCSQAYDSVAPWVMELIYKHHGFPTQLIKLLTNLDKGQQGTVLTGVGKTDTFLKECGLGQGSSLAPLKWKLALDPLLHWQDTLTDKYLLDKEAIGVLAFADDTSFVSTTKEGYLERVNMGNTYFNFFGIENTMVLKRNSYITIQGDRNQRRQ